MSERRWRQGFLALVGLIRPFCQLDLSTAAFVAAEVFDADLLAGLQLPDRGSELAGIGDLLVAHLHDQVAAGLQATVGAALAAAQAGVIGRAAAHDGLHERTTVDGQVQLACDLRVDLGARHAQVGPLHLA